MFISILWVVYILRHALLFYICIREIFHSFTYLFLFLQTPDFMQGCKNFGHLNFERLYSTCFPIPEKCSEEWLIAESVISSSQTAAEFRIFNDAKVLNTVISDAWQRMLVFYQCNINLISKNKQTLPISVHCYFHAFIM